ncbi:MAG: AtpZ/AtpI family protein [Anaerolineaceae bacterium]|nr:AtpZ/AtpI family protein [Anaerolineaceae bacterium]
MGQQPEPLKDRKRYWLNLTLAGAAGQVGCVTLVIILAAVLAGLWLDARFNTRPMFTAILLLASIPVSLAAMLFIVRLFTSKIKAGPPKENLPLEKQEPSREDDL